MTDTPTKKEIQSKNDNVPGATPVEQKKNNRNDRKRNRRGDSKYHEILNNLILLRTKAQKIQKSVRHERYEYYSGKADPDVYEREPFPKKVRDKDALIRYMDADDRVSDANLKVEYYDVMINYTESILKQISNRTYQIKNSIEWHKFQAGFT